MSGCVARACQELQTKGCVKDVSETRRNLSLPGPEVRLRNSGDEGCSLDLYGQCQATLLLWKRDGTGEEVNFVRVLGRHAFAARADVNFSNEKDESHE